MLFVLICWRIDPQSYASRMDLLFCFTEFRLEETSGDETVQPPLLEQVAQDQCPVKFGVSPQMETPQFLWAFCASVLPPLQ